jgi:hypothetical protein
MLGLLEELVSRSWMNSLKAVTTSVRIEAWSGGLDLTLRLLQHNSVLLLFMRQAFDESIHIKAINLSAALLLSRWSI